MFASVWQFLTAVFFVSALLKLVYKLIKEETRPPSRPAAGEAAGTVSEQQELGQISANFRHDSEVQQRQVDLGAEWELPGRLEQQHLFLRSQHGLGQSGAATSNQVEFSAESNDDDIDDDDESDRESDQSQISSSSANQQNDQDNSEGSQDEKRSPRTSKLSVHKKVDEQKVKVNANTKLKQNQESHELLFRQNAQSKEQHFVADINAEIKQSAAAAALALAPKQKSSSLSICSTLLRAKLQAKHQQQQPTLSLANRSAGSQFLLVVADSFLIEPCKFILQVLDSSIKVVWSILDSIEGIESPEVEAPVEWESPQAAAARARARELRRGQQRRASQRRRLLQRRRRLLNLSEYHEEEESDEEEEEDSSGEQSESPERGRGRRQSNYFHRRYLSRRSLSAALLDELDDEQEQRQRAQFDEDYSIDSCAPEFGAKSEQSG